MPRALICPVVILRPWRRLLGWAHDDRSQTPTAMPVLADKPLAFRQTRVVCRLLLRLLLRMTLMATVVFVLTFVLFLLSARGQPNATQSLRNIVYLTGQHQDVPSTLPEMEYVTHVALAFMGSNTFNDPEGVNRTDWPLFTTVDRSRTLFAPGTKILVAVGGWGDTAGFSTAARTAQSRRLFAENMATMVTVTGADGVDVDWEYPGGNGEDYRQVPNAEKAWEIEAYPLLLAEIRKALGPDRIVSAAVPGKPGDMLAFTRKTVPRIMNSVDFLNVMTYDLMNRRDSVTTHHSGIQNSLTAVDAYIAAGAAPQRLNLGYAYYVKYFKTEHEDCQRRVNQGLAPVGCRTLVMEDPETGADLGLSGSFSWDDKVPSDVKDSFRRAMTRGRYDSVEGGHYYWDSSEDLWWTFETPDTIAKKKFPLVVRNRRLGGVFAWGLGEDAPLYRHFKTVSHVIELIESGEWDNLRDEL